MLECLQFERANKNLKKYLKVFKKLLKKVLTMSFEYVRMITVKK